MKLPPDVVLHILKYPPYLLPCLRSPLQRQLTLTKMPPSPQPNEQPPSKTAEEQALELIAPRKFHQSFTLPATADHEALRITYGISGKEDGEDTPTILFCGGMFGSRWQGPFQNWLAEKEGVRIIYIDRPGFGGTKPVPISQRIPIFLEIVPALLAHLKIKHVALSSQSAGTMFALNLLEAQPGLLSPTKPTVTLFSPWVHQSHTGVSFLYAASLLPDFMLNQWANLTGFMINSAMPTFAASSGILSGISNWFSGVKKVAQSKEELDKENEYLEKLCLQNYGFGMEVQKELTRVVMQYAFAEECSGGNDEARLCLRSIEGAQWGLLDEYPTYIERLKDSWEKKVQEGGEKLVVRILLAEEDALIGEKGKRYLENCWTKEKCGRKGIDIDTVVLEGTDHDSVLDPARGAMGEVYEALRVGRRSFPLANDVIGGS